MRFAFSTMQLRQQCECQVTAERELGLRAAEELRELLAVLETALSVGELVESQLIDARLDPTGDTLEAVGGFVRIVFGANHTKVPTSHEGVVDWSNVKRIKILRIEARDE